MQVRTVAAVVCALALVGCKKKPAPADAVVAVPADVAVVAPVDAAVPTGDAAIAIAVMTHLARGEYAEALALGPPGVPITVEIISKAWTDKAADGGALRTVTARAFPEDPAVFSVRATLERGTVDATIVIRDGKAQNLAIHPRYVAPDYVDPSKFTDVELAVGTGKTALPGVLSVPAGAGPWPVVVLMQGSGPSDLDEGDGVHPVLLFRDLAWGLASQGVAVLRFDKRSLAIHFGELGVAIHDFTVQHEYLDPIAEASAAVRADPRLDGKRVFVLGHSQGGWLVPWMLRDHPELAGAIIASGNARNLADLLPEQIAYLGSLQPNVTPAMIAASQKMIAAQIARSHDRKLADDAPPAELPLGIPAPYWKFLQRYDAPAVIAAETRPVLVLQGGRDYNVTATDLALWKKALAGKPGATFREYPDLEHHYLAGTGKSTPAELAAGGHAARVVIDDIAAWVKAH